MVGRTLKHFVIEGKLGSGGMGVVYQARDTRLQRPVALKVFSNEVTADAEKGKRFIQEARAAARIGHPAIAQIYDVDEAEGIMFIAMELVEGKTVQALIQKRELDLLGSLDIGIQVAEGLGRAHEAGIVHRDIKPANLMLAKDGQVKILDFGLAKLLDAPAGAPVGSTAAGQLSTVTQTLPGTVMGTAAYMSPEQVRGGSVDSRSDLFSLGVMLFEMATGESPFRRPALVETMHAVAFDETPSIYALRPNLPEDLQRILSRTLRKRPEDRYPNAGALGADLKLLRRDIESGRAPAPAWRDRLGDVALSLRRVRPGQYAWLGGGGLALGAVVYAGTSRLGWTGLAALVAAGLLLYRYLRNRPLELKAALARRVSRYPEVRFITAVGQDLTVVVDRPAAHLYARIDRETNACNKKLFFGPPLTVTVRSDLPAAERERRLNEPGVCYVRNDLAGGPDPGGR